MHFEKMPIFLTIFPQPIKHSLVTVMVSKHYLKPCFIQSFFVYCRTANSFYTSGMWMLPLSLGTTPSKQLQSHTYTESSTTMTTKMVIQTVKRFYSRSHIEMKLQSVPGLYEKGCYEFFMDGFRCIRTNGRVI